MRIAGKQHFAPKRWIQNGSVRCTHPPRLLDAPEYPEWHHFTIILQNMFAHGIPFHSSPRRESSAGGCVCCLYICIFYTNKSCDLLLCALFTIPPFQFSFETFAQSIYFSLLPVGGMCPIISIVGAKTHRQTEKEREKKTKTTRLQRPIGVSVCVCCVSSNDKGSRGVERVVENKALAKSKLENGKVYAYI